MTAATETRDIDRFIRERRILMEATQVSSNPNMSDDEWAKGASHWRVTLRINAASFETYYSMGSAHTEPPTAADVLDSLASDASTLAEGTFEDWATSLGYNPDSISDLHTYNTIKGQGTLCACSWAKPVTTSSSRTSSAYRSTG